jgi:heme/copper-type cytochrome/quinol oxidase subunit 1
MPRLSVWFIRASLVYLAIGFSFGALLLANKGLAFGFPLDQILPVHMEFLLVGWVMQLALGIAYWILPRYVEGLPRGNETMAWLSLIFLNAGILIVAMTTAFNVDWFVLLGRGCEAVSVLSFLLVTWQRVRSSG